MLYLVKAKETDNHDVATGFVVIAKSHAEARQLASVQCGCEGPLFWFDPTKSTVKQLYHFGTSKIILRSFKSG